MRLIDPDGVFGVKCLESSWARTRLALMLLSVEAIFHMSNPLLLISFYCGFVLFKILNSSPGSQYLSFLDKEEEIDDV